MTDIISLPKGIPSLNQYYVYMTAGCNLACQHCWLSPKYNSNGTSGGHLDYDLFKLALEEGIPLGLHNVKMTGGEPLLHPDFLRMVDLIKEKNLGLTLETNGTLITQEIAQYLRDNSSLSFVSVSIDGATPETHDSFRGVKGSFKKACDGLRYLVEADYGPQVIMSLHPGNLQDIENEIKLVEELGAKSLKFNLIQQTGRGELMDQRNQLLSINKLIEIGNWIEEDLQKSTPIQLLYDWPMAFFRLQRILHRGSSTCGIFSILGILPNGSIAMCGIGMAIPELVYGQLGIDTVKDVWFNNIIIENMRQTIPDNFEGICGNCIFNKQCLGSCIAGNYHQSKKLTAPFWFCRQAEEVGLFPTTRYRNSKL